jgi:hypothetical protein
MSEWLKAAGDDALGWTVNSATSSAHNFSYAPSGLRVRDQRTGSSPHDKRYIYTTAGALMTAYTGIPTNFPRRWAQCRHCRHRIR